MKPGTPLHSYRAPRTDLPPLTWPAPLDALPPLGISKAPESPGWQDTMPLDAGASPELFDIERGTAFEESLNGLQVRELIGNRLFDQLFGKR
ncbi:MAG: hypothetical protein ACOZJX_13795 [Pseudomonadota bacterium]